MARNPKTKKLLGITAEPEVGEFVLDDADEFLICACDGLWDVMQNKQAIDFCRKSLQRHGDPRRASRELSAQALRQGSTDNVSVVVVSFIERPGFRWGGGTDGEPASARRLRTTNEPGSGVGSTSGAGGGALGADTILLPAHDPGIFEIPGSGRNGNQDRTGAGIGIGTRT